MSLLRYRIQYQLTAKGRHGTHSPFIYRFVEEILRQNNKKSDAEIASELKTLLLKYPKSYRSILQYLWASNAGTIDVKVNAVKLSFKNIFESADVNDAVFKVENLLITDKISLNDLSSYDSVIVLNPHANNKIHTEWIHQKSNTEFQYHLDMWHWGLLLKNENFKTPQQFLLR